MIRLVGGLTTTCMLLIAIAAFANDYIARVEDSAFQKVSLEYQIKQVHRLEDAVRGLSDLALSQSMLLGQVARSFPEMENNPIIASQITELTEKQEVIFASLGELAPPLAKTALGPASETMQPKDIPPIIEGLGPNIPYEIPKEPDSGNESTQPEPRRGRNGAEENAESENNATENSPTIDGYPFKGNLVTCVPPNPPNAAWVTIYRLSDKYDWVVVNEAAYSLSPDGYLKLDALPVDIWRFSGRGEPYRIDKYIDGIVADSVGDFIAGDDEFRIFPFVDNSTNWPCP